LDEGRGAAGRRRIYLDWLRGVAVLLMIEAHLFDGWVHDSQRDTPEFRYAIAIGGMGTAFFLMLAGVSAALSAGSKTRRSGDPRGAAVAVAKHGLFIFALAFLFRLQALILGGSTRLADLLRVDILNIMGPSIVLVGLIWSVACAARGRALVLGAAAAAISFATPFVRSLPWGALPDPIEAYVIPVQGLSNFVFFPWLGLAFAGGAIGVLIDAAQDPEQERRLSVAMGAAGALLAALAYAASYLPSPFPGSSFWTSSPSYFFIRVGLVTLSVSVAHGWTTWRRSAARWSPLLQLGGTSLFIYWVHVEMIYGLPSKPLHRSLDLPSAAMACVLFTGLMLACSIVKAKVSALVPGLRRSRTAAG
jgi:uncharacterized membrane protein